MEKRKQLEESSLPGFQVQFMVNIYRAQRYLLRGSSRLRKVTKTLRRKTFRQFWRVTYKKTTISSNTTAKTTKVSGKKAVPQQTEEGPLKKAVGYIDSNTYMLIQFTQDKLPATFKRATKNMSITLKKKRPKMSDK